MASTNGQDTERKDPARSMKGAPPHFGLPVIPHVVTFQGLVSSVARAYRNPDEGVKHSLDNVRFMRNDLSIMECLESRQRCSALLDWHLEVDGPKMPKHEALKDRLTAILKGTPRFTEYRRWLLEAIWFGRSAVQHELGWKMQPGRKDLVIKAWEPINGDKLVFRHDDGTGRFPRNQIGVRVGQNYTAGELVSGRKVEMTDQGMAMFLSPDERALIAVHRHMVEDAAFETPMDAGAIHGIGIRSRIYWTWFQKQEMAALMAEYVERSAMGFEIWTYPEGNPQAQAATEEAAKNRVGRRNVILFPKPIGDDQNAYGVEHYEPSAAGLDALMSLIKTYYGHAIKRYILGQTLTSEADATGMGSGVADLHLQTMLDIIKYDATNLEESITHETLDFLKDFNEPNAVGVDVQFKLNTQTPDVEQKLSGFKAAWEMGAKLKESDIMDAIGAGIPTEGERALQNPQAAQQDAAQAQQAGGVPVSSSNASIDPERFKQAFEMAGGHVDGNATETGLRDGLEGQGVQVDDNPALDPARGVARYSESRGIWERVDYTADGQWITIGAHDHEGGTPVLVGEGGKIMGGPAALAGKSLGSLDSNTGAGSPKGEGPQPEAKPVELPAGPGADAHAATRAAGTTYDQGSLDSQRKAKKAHATAYKHFSGLANDHASAGRAEDAYAANEQATKHKEMERLHAGNSKHIMEKMRGLGLNPLAYVPKGGATKKPAGTNWEPAADGASDADAGGDPFGDADSFDPSSFGDTPKPKKRGKYPTKSKFDQDVQAFADDYGVDPWDLRDAADFVFEEKRDAIESRERAKAEARALTGLTLQDVQRITNDGYDFSSHKLAAAFPVAAKKLAHFDAFAQEVARNHPELGLGDPDDKNSDFAEPLWAILGEGKQRLPARHDPEILKEAANVVLASHGSQSDLEYTDQFARRGTVERYKKHKVAAGQRSLFDEADHPRDDDGKFTAGAGESTGYQPPPMNAKNTTPTQGKLFGPSARPVDSEPAEDVKLAPEPEPKAEPKKTAGDEHAIRRKAREHINGMLDRANKGPGVTKAQMETYRQTLHIVANNMPPAMLEAATKHAAKVEFHATLPKLSRAIAKRIGRRLGPGQLIGGSYRPDVTNIAPIGPGRTRADQLHDMTADGLGILTLDGGYNDIGPGGKCVREAKPVPKELESQFKANDSETAEHIYAHELGHAIDWAASIPDDLNPSRRVRLSTSTEWVEAWESEIRTKPQPGTGKKVPNLTQYAESSAAEGMAEFVRAVTFEPQWAKETFPKAWAVFVSKGLLT